MKNIERVRYYIRNNGNMLDQKWFTRGVLYNHYKDYLEYKEVGNIDPIEFCSIMKELEFEHKFEDEHIYVFIDLDKLKDE